MIAIPKSVNKDHIEENFNIWDFELSQNNMDTIAKKGTGHSLILNPFLPSEVKRVYNYDK